MESRVITIYIPTTTYSYVLSFYSPKAFSDGMRTGGDEY